MFCPLFLHTTLTLDPSSAPRAAVLLQRLWFPPSVWCVFSRRWLAFRRVKKSTFFFFLSVTPLSSCKLKKNGVHLPQYLIQLYLLFYSTYYTASLLTLFSMCFLHKPLIPTVFGVCGGLFVSKKRTLQTKQREIFSFPMHKINTRFSFKFLYWIYTLPVFLPRSARSGTRRTQV